VANANSQSEVVDTTAGESTGLFEGRR